MTTPVAIIGGRGYAGATFLDLLHGHPKLELALASSSSRWGQTLESVAPEWKGSSRTFETLEPGQVGEVDAGVWILALPNGLSDPWVQALNRAHPDAVIVDLGADYRFDSEWFYGLPELTRQSRGEARLISNPGCYATGAQLALAPVAESLQGLPVLFAVSGYSGAGRTPSPRNDPERLAQNLIPYSLTGHLHEREVGHHLGREVRFSPHVAQFFRGISITVAAEFADPVEPSDLLDRFAAAFDGEPLVGVQAEVPEIREVRETPHTLIGGFQVDARDPRRAHWVVVLDNLLKGAASQALQNVNLALGLDETLGVLP